MERNIHSSELDGIARPGLETLRNLMHNPNPSSEDQTRGELALKLISQGTRRMSAETNRASVAYKIAKENGFTAEVVRPALELLLPTPDASAGVATKTRRPLASSKSTPSSNKTEESPEVG